MNTIKKKEIYTHPLSEDVFESEIECQKAYEETLKEKEESEKVKSEFEYRANYIRLNARSVEEIREMIEKYSHEWWGVNIKFTEFRFSYTPNQSITHGAPIGVATDWHCERGEKHPGFRGRISGKMKKKGDIDGISMFFGSWGQCMKGFHTGTGSCGFNFDIDAYFFIQDYPLIAAKHKEWVAFKENYIKEETDRRTLQARHLKKLEKIYDETPEVIANNGIINKLRDEISDLTTLNDKIREEINSENPFLFDVKYPISGLPEARKMFGEFNGIFY